MNKVKQSFLSLGIIILGVGCMAWAIVSLWTQSNYSTTTDQMAYSKNTTSSYSLSDETIDKKDSPKIRYLPYPSVGENIGVLSIPVLEQEFPIIQGTGSKELKEGVGHFLQSVLPGEKDNCVLSGHRDTVFRKLGNLEIGDLLILTTSPGTFIYRVDGTRIVNGDDKTVIVSTEDAVLTLVTCYPFKGIGKSTQRYIVSAVLVINEEALGTFNK